MKRWLWLLAVPYTVIFSTDQAPHIDANIATSTMTVHIKKSGDCIKTNGSILIVSDGRFQPVDPVCVYVDGF